VIDEICSHLDGLPLGIELAAARAGLLPLPVIRDRLIARLPLPGAGSRDAPERQRTLEGAVAWSHDLLDPALQATFRSLSTFEGGFDLDQAEAVVGRDGTDTLDALLRLADQNLIQPDPGGDDRIRFSMLKTIGSFAQERLRASGEEDHVRRRHAEAFMALVEATAAQMTTSAQPTAMDRLHPEDANVRAAIRWAIDHGVAEIAQRILAATWRYWSASGQLATADTLATDTLAMPAGQDRTRHRMWATGAAGNIAYWQADSRLAAERYQQERALAEELADEEGQADAVFNLAHVDFIQGEDEERIARLSEEALARYRALGDRRMVARAHWAGGVIALQAGQIDESRAELTAGLVEFEANDDPQYHAMTLASLGWGAFVKGDLESAIKWAVDSILESYAMRDVATTAISLHVGVLIAVVAERPEDAVRLSGAFDALTERYGVRPPAALGHFIRGLDPFAMARDAVPPDRVAELNAEGRAMALDEAVALVAEIGAGAGGGRRAIA
jgi:tetratricopeptide (TPR) repeat protein